MIWRRSDPGNGVELPVGEAPAPKRRRVVLADSRAPVTVLRGINEVEEQTSVGEQFVRDFMHAQLRTACLFLGGVAVLLGAIPLAAYFSPGFASAAVLGIRLPWLLIGVLPFPLLFAIGYAYHRISERREREFVRDLER